MSQIKGKDTKPEMLVRKLLFSKGFRYKLYDNKLPGKPDIVLPKYKSAIFIHGCFWHGHDNCKYFVVPKTRTKWWLKKINGNQDKDLETFSRLTQEGWRVFTIFECQLKPHLIDRTLKKIITRLSNNVVAQNK